MRRETDDPGLSSLRGLSCSQKGFASLAQAGRAIVGKKGEEKWCKRFDTSFRYDRGLRELRH
eukprot:2346814-Pyramimonas_sp.AAC.1